jgi:hypothetical protein
VSRDIFVQDLPPGISSVTEIPDDFAPGLIGDRAQVLAAIQHAAPNADLSDPSWIVLTQEGKFHIEVSLANDEQLSGFAFHIAGGGIEAERLIAQILERLGLRALDTASASGLFTNQDLCAP